MQTEMISFRMYESIEPDPAYTGGGMMKKIIKFIWILFLSLFLSSPKAQMPRCILQVATLSHFGGPENMASFVQEQYEKNSDCKVRYRLFPDFPQLINALPHLIRENKVDIVVGLLRDDFLSLTSLGLSQPQDYVYAPIGIIYNPQIAQAYFSLKKLLQQSVTIIAPHSQNSQTGKAWQAWLKHLQIEPKAKILYFPSWDTAFKAFLEGVAPYVVSYTTSAAAYSICNKHKMRPMIFQEGHPTHYYSAAYVKTSPHALEAQKYIKTLLSPPLQRLIPHINYMYPVRRSVYQKSLIALDKLPLPKKILALPYQPHVKPTIATTFHKLPRILFNSISIGIIVTLCCYLLGVPLGLLVYGLAYTRRLPKFFSSFSSLFIGFISLVICLPSMVTFSALRKTFVGLPDISWVLISMTWLEATAIAFITYIITTNIDSRWIFLSEAFKLSAYQKLKAVVFPHLRTHIKTFAGFFFAFNSMNMIPFLFCAPTPWLTFNAFLYQQMHLGMSQLELCFGLVLHLLFAFMISHYIRKQNPASSIQKKGRPLFQTSLIYALLALSIFIIWLFPIFRIYIPSHTLDFIGSVILRADVLEATKNSLVIASMALLTSALLIIVAITVLLRSPSLERLFKADRKSVV